jgi:hypothetical protein
MAQDDGWTKTERMQVWIMRHLKEKGACPGWRMWESISEDQYIELERYEFYRRQLGALERLACIVKTGHFDNSEKKGKHWGTAFWSLTPEGAELLDTLERQYMVWARSADDEEPSGIEDKWIGRSITADNLVPKEEWRELLNALRAGRLGFRVFALEDAEDLL